MEAPVKVKLFLADYDSALEIQTMGQTLIRTLTLHEILREAVHAGLPLVAAKYKTATDAVAKTKPK